MRAFAAKDGETSKGTVAGKEKAEKMIRRKKMMAVLTVLAILTGSLGMTATAAVDPGKCEHPNVVNITAGEDNSTYTHPAWVANKPNGEPVLVPCTVTSKKQNWKRICAACGQVFNEWQTIISETHSIHH